MKLDRLPAVLATLNKLLLAAPAVDSSGKAPALAPGAKASPSSRVAAASDLQVRQLTLWRAGENVFLGAGGCSFKFRILSNDRLLE